MIDLQFSINNENFLVTPSTTFEIAEYKNDVKGDYLAFQFSGGHFFGKKRNYLLVMRLKRRH